MEPLNLHLSAVEAPRTVLLPEHKGGKRHGTAPACPAGANLPVRRRKVVEKTKEELKGTNSSLTRHV